MPVRVLPADTCRRRLLLFGPAMLLKLCHLDQVASSGPDCTAIVAARLLLHRGRHLLGLLDDLGLVLLMLELHALLLLARVEHDVEPADHTGRVQMVVRPVRVLI